MSTKTNTTTTTSEATSQATTEGYVNTMTVTKAIGTGSISAVLDAMPQRQQKDMRAIMIRATLDKLQEKKKINMPIRKVLGYAGELTSDQEKVIEKLQILGHGANSEIDPDTPAFRFVQAVDEHNGRTPTTLAKISKTAFTKLVKANIDPAYVTANYQGIEDWAVDSVVSMVVDGEKKSAPPKQLKKDRKALELLKALEGLLS